LQPLVRRGISQPMSDQDASDEWQDRWMAEVNNLGEMLAAM
jgi:hypothetical protein